MFKYHYIIKLDWSSEFKRITKSMTRSLKIKILFSQLKDITVYVLTRFSLCQRGESQEIGGDEGWEKRASGRKCGGVKCVVGEKGRGELGEERIGNIMELGLGGEGRGEV